MYRHVAGAGTSVSGAAGAASMAVAGAVGGPSSGASGGASGGASAFEDDDQACPPVFAPRSTTSSTVPKK